MEKDNWIDKEWKLSFVSEICIGIEVQMSEGYSMVLLNTILPDTDKAYKKLKPDIEGLMRHICDLHNKTLPSPPQTITK